MHEGPLENRAGERKLRLLGSEQERNVNNIEINNEENRERSPTMSCRSNEDVVRALSKKRISEEYS